ncbi:coenzyme PQQ biosynthesis protein PqqD [Chthonomonas calidirosea]|uniref:Coenzyme PQQ biosynthesis protein PqqD n=1 Tax=Chthonomonas calidirosea (strain DSM 23976 / ICMP 18418 / T49) TaxID=1303518 RepID=S0ESI2_CHTCT|nr:pyrroloquinoline quinone biosynthesis peptide chaperone PqqD [Chthonomonas calidirosea]CCW34184.1 coenzyme PQQ biosynthesis protein PqqD [Chthonomonas calidirosea T49]CEK15519.1 coenzyme PQQ biosynthesis protein PqqD [Chthonomonas calidirosea]
MSSNSLPLNAIPILSSYARLQQDRVTGKMVLVYPEGVLLLNETASAVLKLCDGYTDLATICSKLCEQYSASAESLIADVQAYLHRLHQRNLIIFEDEPPSSDQNRQ